MNIDRQKLMEHIGRWFGIDPEEDGTWDIESYDWTSGCSIGYGFDERDCRADWMTLGEFVRCMEWFLEDLDPYDFIDEDDF